MALHSCYDCVWECLDGCCLKRDDNGNREPVYDIPTDCKDFEKKKKIDYYDDHDSSGLLEE